MEEIRVLIQSKLDEIVDIDSGVPVPDGMVEMGKTYFGYELQGDYIGSDLDENYTYDIHLTGRLVRQVDDENEDTLQIMDNQLKELKNKFKEINFRMSYNDVSFDDNIRKYMVRARGRYNEINNMLVV